MKIYTFKSFKTQEHVNHGISTKYFGSMKNEENSINRNNLNKFLTVLNLPLNAICMGQVHGGNVETIKNDKQLLIKNTDGLITDKKNIPLCIVVADCLPVLFFDKKRQIIGVAHAGRKGLMAGIIANTLNKFVEEFKSDTKDIIVGIGPGIEKHCYKVNGEYVDIRQIAINQLLRSGIDKSNIESLDVCTKCNKEELYSYRNGDIFNRFVAVISLI